MAINSPAIFIVEDEGVVALGIQRHLYTLGYTFHLRNLFLRKALVCL